MASREERKRRIDAARQEAERSRQQRADAEAEAENAAELVAPLIRARQENHFAERLRLAFIPKRFGDT